MKSNNAIYNRRKGFNNSINNGNSLEQELQNDYGASDYDMMMIFGTSASEQRQYLKDNPHLDGIIEPMEAYVTSRLLRS